MLNEFLVREWKSHYDKMDENTSMEELDFINKLAETICLQANHDLDIKEERARLEETTVKMDSIVDDIYSYINGLEPRPEV